MSSLSRLSRLQCDLMDAGFRSAHAGIGLLTLGCLTLDCLTLGCLRIPSTGSGAGTSSRPLRSTAAWPQVVTPPSRACCRSTLRLGWSLSRHLVIHCHSLQRLVIIPYHTVSLAVIRLGIRWKVSSWVRRSNTFTCCLKMMTTCCLLTRWACSWHVLDPVSLFYPPTRAANTQSARLMPVEHGCSG